MWQCQTIDEYIAMQPEAIQPLLHQVHAKAIENFGGRLKEYKTSKGAVQLPYDQPIPLELIAEITQWFHETGNHH